MASRSVSAGWFFVGFLAGMGATLAGIIFATRPQPTRVALPAPMASVAPAGKAVVTYHAPLVAEASPPALAGPIRPDAQEAPPGPAVQTPGPAAAAKPGRTGGPDEQTREDAAAAGMTSRARAGG